MIAFEIMFLIMISIVFVVTIAAVGRPLAEAYAERMKAKYRELEPEEKRLLQDRLSSLEQEVIDLRHQVKQIQDTTDFAVRMLETSKGELRSDKDH